MLLVPSFGLIAKTGYLSKNSGIKLLLSYCLSLMFFGLVGIASYIFNISILARLLLILFVVLGTYFFVKDRRIQEMRVYRFPLVCLLFISLLPTLFLSLGYTKEFTYLPDPEPLSERNYDAYNVKVLNIAKTQANDNYIPYRQAQFIVNRSNAGNDCFICEWGVHFFQRTPLMGSITASFFILLDDKPPIDYLWSSHSTDSELTYQKFQLIAHILNGIFIIPAYYLLAYYFKKRVAIISCLLLSISPFFLYNAIFSWPKSLVAFFVLTMWLLLYENKLRFTVIASVVAGLAYLTHDLAAFYVVASILYLLTKKRFRDIFILGGGLAFFALPWVFTSSFIYDKPSTFALYPFSLDGLPQPGTQKQIFEKFFNTSPIEIVSIRFDTLFYLLTPYDLIYKTGDQDFIRRLWATGLYSIPGSLGLGLIFPAIAGAIKRLAKYDFWVLIATPVLLSAGIVGWRGSRAIASLHFAQAIIVLLTGLAVAFTLQLKGKIRRPLIYSLCTLKAFGLVFLIYFSYPDISKQWMFNWSNFIPLIMTTFIICLVFYLIYSSMKNKLPRWLSEQ